MHIVNTLTLVESKNPESLIGAFSRQRFSTNNKDHVSRRE